MDFKQYLHEAPQLYHWMDEETLRRYLSTYGTHTDKILKGCNKRSDLGHCFMPTLYEKEVDYLIKEEWAKTSTDILWRRTLLGLNKDPQSQHGLDDYIKRQ